MKRNFILPAIVSIGIIVASGFTVVDSNGIANYSGSPVDGGTGSNGTCAHCHSGGATIPTLSVSASPAFGGGGSALTYSAGTTYTITFTPGGSYAAYGFNCEIINSQSTTKTAVSGFGVWGAAVTSNCKKYAAGTYPACYSHSTPSTSPFSCIWTAPASGTGYLYADVNGVNLDGSDNGDHVSAVTSITLTPASTTGIETHQTTDVNLAVFPNPASDNIRISYNLKESGTVSVKLYNLNGDVVADLVNETQEVGLQNMSANLPAGLAKGLYMVKLNVNGEQTTQKLMVR